MELINILGIMGSPRKGRNTEYILSVALEEASKLPDVKTEMIRLVDYNILTCDGCNACLKGRCPLDEKDDMKVIDEKIINADGIIIASPSYWSNVPGMVKTFMDRTRKLKMSNHMLDGKVLAPIAVSALRHGGGSGVIDAIIRLGFDQRMIIVSAPSNPLKDSPFPVGSLQTDTGWRITKEDPIGIKDAKNLGIRVVEVTKALKKYKKGGDSG